MTESKTLHCSSIVKRRLRDGLDVYDCGLGSNALAPPPVFYELIKKYCHNYNYDSIFGNESLQHSLKNNFSSDNYKIKHTMVGHGLKEILFCFHMAYKGTIFHIVPKWVSYGEQSILCNNKIINISVNRDTMKINPRELEFALVQGNINRAILFNNPVNPTGIVYTLEEIKEIAQVCKRTNTIIFADEIYMNLQHDTSFVSIAEFAPDITIRASSISKDFAAGGYRLGWACYPASLQYIWKQMSRIGSSIYSCVSPVMQLATAELLEMDHTEYFNTNRNYFKNLMEQAVNILKETPLTFVKPSGAWYIFVNFEHVDLKINKTIEEFLLTKLDIVCLGGEHFGYNNNFIRFSIKNENSLDGLRVLKKFLNTNYS